MVRRLTRWASATHRSILVTREELQHAPRLRAVWQFVTEVLRENESILMGRGGPDA